MKTGSQCILQKVSITITSEVWNDTLLDRESFDYKTLEASVLTAVSCLNMKAIIITEVRSFCRTYSGTNWRMYRER